MPVRRFRTIDEAPEMTASALDPQNLRVAFDLSDLCLRLAPVSPATGVRRFRSIADARGADERPT